MQLLAPAPRNVRAMKRERAKISGGDLKQQEGEGEGVARCSPPLIYF